MPDTSQIQKLEERVKTLEAQILPACTEALEAVGKVQGHLLLVQKSVISLQKHVFALKFPEESKL